MGNIYLIRHGQASFGADDYDQLSELGRQQSRLLGKALAQRRLHIDTVYCGTLKRHRQTADACLNAMDNIRPIRELNLFNEFDHQEIIHRHTPRYADPNILRDEMERTADPWRSFQTFFNSAMQRWMNDDHQADYREPWHAFQQRSQQALQHICNQTQRNHNILLFTSGGLIASICQQLMELSDHHTLQLTWSLVNTGTTKLIHSTRRCRLSVLNEHSHLDHDDSRITYR